MNELVNLIAKKTGLSQAMAQTVVNTVIDFLKKKLPTPIASRVDQLVKNEGKAGSAADRIGGLLGGAKKTTAAKKTTIVKKTTAARKPAVAIKKPAAAKKITSTAKKPAAKKTGKK